MKLLRSLFTSAIASVCLLQPAAGQQTLDFEPELRAVPSASKATLFDTVLLLDGSRLSRVVSRERLFLVVHDNGGRILSVQNEGGRFTQYFDYSDNASNGHPVGILSIDTLDATSNYRVARGQTADSAKYVLVVDDPEQFDYMSFSSMIEDPFGVGWDMIGLAPKDPVRCKKDSCKELCDAGADVGFTGCGIIALVPGPGPVAGAVCAGAMLGGKYACRARCDEQCLAIGD